METKEMRPFSVLMHSLLEGVSESLEYSAATIEFNKYGQADHIILLNVLRKKDNATTSKLGLMCVVKETLSPEDYSRYIEKGLNEGEFVIAINGLLFFVVNHAEGKALAEEHYKKLEQELELQDAKIAAVASQIKESLDTEQFNEEDS